MKKKSNTSDRQYISFSLDKDNYGLDVMIIESVERMSSITPVPKAPNYVLGVTNIRGDIIPVINLRKRLGMDDRRTDDNTRIIICQFDSYRIGLVVDMAKDVFTVSQQSIHTGEDIFKDNKNDFIS